MYFKFMMKFTKLKNFLLVSLIVFGTTSLSRGQTLKEQNQYVKKQYLFIPRGNGNGQVPGMFSFLVGKKGDVFVLYILDGKSVIKKFSPDGRELASCSAFGSMYLSWDGPDLIAFEQLDSVTNNYIVVIDQDLKKQKIVNFPNDLRVRGTILYNGKAHERFPRKGESREYVYDQQKVTASSTIEKPLDVGLRTKLKRQKKETLLIIQKKCIEATTDKNCVDSSPIKISDFISEPIRDCGSHFFDLLGNIYIQISLGVLPHKGQYESGILKLSPKNIPLAWINLGWDSTARFPNQFHLLVDVDPNGNIYCPTYDQNGTSLSEWEFKNKADE
jgi:hypothetical protein